MRGLALAVVVLLPRVVLAGDLEVREGWVRLPPPGGNAAAYLTIDNAGATPRRLVAARTPVAERVELHASRVEGGVARMAPVEAIAVPPGSAVTLAPRGLHLMLVRPRALREGERVELVLVFDGDESLATELSVRRSPPAPGHGAHP